MTIADHGRVIRGAVLTFCDDPTSVGAERAAALANVERIVRFRIEERVRP